MNADPYDFTGDLDISFWILPDLIYHNGPLFNVGSEDNFKYYEWKTKAVKTQFMVVEITYEAVNVFPYLIRCNGFGLRILRVTCLTLSFCKVDCVTHQSTLATTSISNGTIHNASKTIQFNRWTLGVRKR